VESTRGADEPDGGDGGTPPVADITAHLLRKRLREEADAPAHEPPPPAQDPDPGPNPDPPPARLPPALALPGAGLMGPPPPQHYGTPDHPPSLFTAGGRHLSAGALGHAPPAPLGASSGSGRASGSGSGWESLSGTGTGVDTGTGTGSGTGTATGSGSGAAAGRGSGGGAAGRAAGGRTVSGAGAALPWVALLRPMESLLDVWPGWSAQAVATRNLHGPVYVQRSLQGCRRWPVVCVPALVAPAEVRELCFFDRSCCCSAHAGRVLQSVKAVPCETAWLYNV
jgi:hypothetical protein